MPARHRLTRSHIATLIEGRNRRINGRFFTLVYASLPAGEPCARAACVVSKKIARHAVDRNRIKRRCREILRPQLPTLPLFALMWYARKGATEASFADMREDVEMLLQKIA